MAVMARKSNRKQVNCTVSAAQFEAYQRLKVVTELRGSDLIRNLLETACEQYGIEWPDDLPRRGKHERTE